MRGRDLFTSAAPIIRYGELVLSVIPERLVRIALVLCRGMPSIFGVGMRYLLIRRLTCCCGEVVAVFPDVYLFGLQNTKIGNHVSIHPMCYLDGTGGLTIGSNVSIAHGVTIMTTEHSYEQRDTFIRDAPMQCLPVEIGDDVWIGAGARILAGVRIGDGVVIGAGSVITKDVASNSVAVGVPGRVLKQR